MYIYIYILEHQIVSIMFMYVMWWGAPLCTGLRVNNDTQSAPQAYRDLSKKYHPDKNFGCTCLGEG
jgi:preprotein translocase subunit Sec63